MYLQWSVIWNMSLIPVSDHCQGLQDLLLHSPRATGALEKGYRVYNPLRVEVFRGP